MRKHVDHETITQVQKDGETWVPVAFFSYFVNRDEEPILHQLWVSALGNTKWEPIETRNIEDMTRVYRECQVFSGDRDYTEVKDDDVEV